MRNLPVGIFCYHKCGTTLLSKVFRDICTWQGLRFECVLGYADDPSLIAGTERERDADVVLYGHSTADPRIFDHIRAGIHVTRDPRSIIASGMRYHMVCSERWCTNTNMADVGPILFPQVPISQEYRSRSWKLKYLAGLAGVSYQENLRMRDPVDRLLFEMNHYGRWTVESMIQWDKDLAKWNETTPGAPKDRGRGNIMETRYEEFETRFDDIFSLIFTHLGVENPEKALKIAQKHDLKRKTAPELLKMLHVMPGGRTNWRDFFEPVHEEEFERIFGREYHERWFRSIPPSEAREG